MKHLNFLARLSLLASLLILVAPPLQAQISISSKTSDKAPTVEISKPVQNHAAQMAKSADSYTYAAYTGRIACDSKSFVTVTEDPKHPNHFTISFGKASFKLTRVPTDSGAIRLEDKAHGIVWLQMANKSMLLDEKHGKRLATNCQNDAQLAADKALSTSTTPTVLDAPKPQ
jgi:hypothetical protein